MKSIYKLYKRIDKKLNYIKSNFIEPYFSNNIYNSYEKKYDSVISKLKRSSIIWPLPKEIKFMPLMSENELSLYYLIF